MNDQSKGLGKVKIYLLTVVMVIGFIFLLMVDMNNKKLEENGVKTQATIVEITNTRTKRGVTSKYGIAEYYDEQGNVHQFEGFVGNWEANVGTKIDIIYEKDNPDNVIKDNPYLIFAVVGVGIFAALLVASSLLITFRGKDKLSVTCMHQPVSNEELARIVREYMPQTKNNYLSKRNKYKSFDKLGEDAVLNEQIKSGDPLGELMKTGQQYARDNGELYLCAVIRPTDTGIFTDKISLSDDPREAAGGRYTVPAFVVYSTDGYFEAHPSELITAAQRLAGEVWGGQFSPQDMQLIDFLRNPSSRPFDLSYSGDLTMGHRVFITTVVLDKVQLCNKKLSNKLLYILASPGNSKFAQILPAWYYTMWELSAF